jgi:hypothetical protein
MQTRAYLERLDEQIAHQQEVLLKCARRIVPHVILDDLMQPNDFPDLEMHPIFRYEEGVLHGLQIAKTACLQSLALFEVS